MLAATRPLVAPEACDRIVRECEAHAAALGGWSTARHPDENYPTTDIPVHQLNATAAWLREELLPEAAWPFIAHAFGFAFGGAECDAFGEELLGVLRDARLRLCLCVRLSRWSL